MSRTFRNWAADWPNNASPAAPDHLEQPCDMCGGHWAIGPDGAQSHASHEAADGRQWTATAPTTDDGLDALADGIVTACGPVRVHQVKPGDVRDDDGRTVARLVIPRGNALEGHARIDYADGTWSTHYADDMMDDREGFTFYRPGEPALTSTYRVEYGIVAGVTVTVEAEDEDEARAHAYTMAADALPRGLTLALDDPNVTVWVDMQDREVMQVTAE